MDCVANDNNFGCMLEGFGHELGTFLNVAGSPFATVLFLILIAGAIIYLFIAGKNTLS